MKLQQYLPAVLLFLSTSFTQAQSLDWAGTFGGGGNESVNELYVGPDGAIYTRGTFSDTTDLDPGPGQSLFAEATPYATFIQKLDADGDLVWGLSTHKGALTGAYSCFAFDPAGYLFNAETFVDPVDVDPGPGVQTMVPAGNKDVYIQQFDTSGSLQWARQLSSPNLVDRIFLAHDGSGGVWAYMRFFDSLDVDPGPGADFLQPVGSSVNNALLHFDANGDVVGVGRTGYLNYCNMHVASNGDVLISGGISDTTDVDPGPGVQLLWPDGPAAIVLLRIDPQGNLIWARKIDESGSNYINWITTDAAGNAYSVGWFEDPLDMDPGPGVSTITPAGQGDAFIWKLDPQGDLAAAYAFGGTDNEEPFAIEVGASGDLYVVGYFQGTTDLDPGPGVQAATSQGSYDGFFLHLSPTGQYYSSGTIGGTAADHLGMLRLDAMENVFMGGGFRETADIDPGMGTLSASAVGQRDALILRLNANTVALAEEESSGLLVFPNPANELVRVMGEALPPSAVLDLHDLSGRRVATTSAMAGRAVLDVKHLPAGVYVLSDREGRLAPQRVVVR